MPIGANLQQAGTGNTPGQWYSALPPVTKLLGTACVATTAAASFGILPYPLIVLLWPRVLRRLEVSPDGRRT